MRTRRFLTDQVHWTRACAPGWGSFGQGHEETILPTSKGNRIFPLYRSGWLIYIPRHSMTWTMKRTMSHSSNRPYYWVTGLACLTAGLTVGIGLRPPSTSLKRSASIAIPSDLVYPNNNGVCGRDYGGVYSTETGGLRWAWDDPCGSD